MSFGFTELIIVLVIVLIIFGAGRLPELGEGLGRAIRNFRKATSEPEAIDVTPQGREEGAGSNSQQQTPKT